MPPNKLNYYCVTDFDICYTIFIFKKTESILTTKLTLERIILMPTIDFTSKLHPLKDAIIEILETIICPATLFHPFQYFHQKILQPHELHFLSQP